MIQYCLNHLNILVTRPSPDGERYCEIIRAAGGNAIHFPTVEIISLPMNENFVDFDWLIFVSPQAVRMSLPRCQFSSQTNMAVIGAGTAHVLSDFYSGPVLFPKKNPSAASLLALPELQDVKNQRIGLVQGQFGRTELFETLTARGAKVTPLIVYNQVCAKPSNLGFVEQLIRDNQLHAILHFSGQSIHNILIILNNFKNAQITSIPIVVISQRLVDLAKRLGFQKILLAENPQQDVIMTVLQQLVNR